MVQIIFSLDDNNVESSVELIMNTYDEEFSYTFNFMISQMVYYSFVSHRKNFEIYLKFMQILEIKEKKINPNISNIINMFINFIVTSETNESYFITEKLIEHNLYDIKNLNFTYNFKKLYFAHLLKDEEIHEIKKLSSDFFNNFYYHFDELSKNDWKLHKQLIEEGENPNEIAKIIRKDEIEKLQEISSQNDFDFNQAIESSIYERYSFVNQRNVTLIDYAAFFGSIKCFKYLLMNGSDIKNTGKYAVAGGNKEIIHLCEQNHSTFEGAYETAIKFHRNDIFKYLYENNLENLEKGNQENSINLEMIKKIQMNFDFPTKSLEIFERIKNKNISDIIKCIQYHNYQIFSFLEDKIEINDIIRESAIHGNLYLIKDFLNKDNIPPNILVLASGSGNVELVKYLIEEKGINNINEHFSINFIYMYHQMVFLNILH